MMTCRDLYGFLDEFLEGGLDAETGLRFALHLDQCSACRRYLTTYQTTLKVARDAETADAPARAEAPEDLIRAILASRRPYFL